MSDLTAFVVARLDEDERKARANYKRPIVPLAACRVRRNTPYLRHALYRYGTPVAHMLVSIWSDHPDYRSEWAP